MIQAASNTQAGTHTELVRAAVAAYLATPESFALITATAMQPRLERAWQKAERRRFATEPEPITGFGELAPRSLAFSTTHQGSPMKQRVIKVCGAVLLGLFVLVCLMVIADYHDPAPPPDVPTKTCEPIGAQHPKATSAECTR